MSAGTWRISGTISRFPLARKPYSHAHIRSPHPPVTTRFDVPALLTPCWLVLHGHGLHILCGGHCGLGFPSASTWIEFKRTPASSKVPTRNSKNLRRLATSDMALGSRFDRPPQNVIPSVAERYQPLARHTIAPFDNSSGIIVAKRRQPTETTYRSDARTSAKPCRHDGWVGVQPNSRVALR